MNLVKSLAPLVLALFVSGCDIDKMEKANSDEYVLIKKAELEQLRRDADQGRSVGRYREFGNYGRTWRLDTATGKTCLLLASEWDWKHDAKDQVSCAIVDYANK